MRGYKKLVALLVAAGGATMGAFAEWTCRLDVPDGAQGESRTGIVTYVNTGSAAIAAPLVRVEAGDGAYVRFSESDAWAKSVEFLATSAKSPASSLRAGETVEQPVFVYSDAEEAQVTLSWTLASSEQIPWRTLSSSIWPSYFPVKAKMEASSALTANLGNTWDSYLARLRSDADYLAGLGMPTRRTDRLMQMEMNLALGNDAALPVLASTTDAFRAGRGLNLQFVRTYRSAMTSRLTKGILGYGWTDNLSTYAELCDDMTLVFRLPAGGSYSFSKTTGEWRPQDARDATTLSETTSSYVLSYEDGTVQTFEKSNMRTSTIADNRGNSLTFEWNGTLLSKVSHNDGQFLSFAYYGDNLLKSVTDDVGRTTEYEYDLFGKLVKATALDGTATSYEYLGESGTSREGALARIVYQDGTTKEFSYDTKGFVGAISLNGGKRKATIVRSGAGTTTITAPDGGRTAIHVGPSGEVLKTVDALGNVSKSVYSADGLLVSVVAPSGKKNLIGYDNRGRATSSATPSGRETAFAYEAQSGNLASVTDPLGNSIAYDYDDKGRGISVDFPDGSASRVEYNSRGDVWKTYNRRGQAISYEYDSQGRLKKKTWPNGRTFAYAYDDEGNMVAASDSEMGTVSMYYIVGGRLNCIFYPNGRAIYYDYDEDTGKVALRMSGRATVTGTPPSPNPEYEVWQQEFRLDWDYDDAERYIYDEEGRISAVQDWDEKTILQNTYDAKTGRLAKQTYGNGASATYAYDLMGRVTSITHKDKGGRVREALAYRYDKDGKCIASRSLEGEETYGYDADGQLTSVVYPDGKKETFAYDAVGNRIQTGGAQSSATYTVNNLNQYTEIVNAQAARSTIAYDADGNMTSVTDADGTTTFTYDVLNRLVAATNETRGLRWSCRYDVFGNRVAVTDNGVTTDRVFLPGSLPSVAAEYVNGELKERHVVVGGVRIADVAAGGSQSSATATPVRWYHADLIGSTRLVTDENGAMSGRAAYMAFGETRKATGDIPDAGYVGTLGVETDPTALLFMRNRYYAPGLGRFIQMDPIGLNGEDVNLYRYCDNNPIVGIDPTGEFVITVAGAIAFAAKAALAYGYTKIIFDSFEEGFDLWINGDFNKEQWMENATSLIIGGSLGKGAAAEPMKKAGKKLIPISVKMANNWGARTVAKKYTPYLARDAVSSLVAKLIVGMTPIETSIEVPVPIPEGGSGGDGSGTIMNQDDWLRIAADTSEERNGAYATYSLGTDITIDFDRRRSALHDSDGHVKGFKDHESDGLYDSSYLTVFSGKLKGNGHKIYITGTHYIVDGNTGESTLFGAANGATFEDVTFVGSGVYSAQNCTFKNCTFTRYPLADTATSCTFESCGGTAEMTGTASIFQMGAITRVAKSCTFINCKIDGVVKGENDTGGMVGQAEDCSFTACLSKATVSGEDNVGGLVGWAETCDFMNSAARGTVSGNGQVGGLVGFSKNCNYATCQAKGTVTGGDTTGGFAGDLRGGNVSKCSATGKVVCDKSRSNTPDDIGGFAGQIIGDAAIGDCAAVGAVSAAAANSVGGFAGSVKDATVQRCYASGAVTGGGVVGGFAGQLMQCKVYNCYAAGAVAAKGFSSGSGATKSTLAYAGGLAGMADSAGGADCRYCYAFGKVTTIKANLAKMVLAYSGGLTPLPLTAAQVGSMPASVLKTLMSDCVACYWNTTTTGQKYSGMGSGKATAAMKKKATFSGWDSSVWTFSAGYPYLAALGKTGSLPLVGETEPVPPKPTKPKLSLVMIGDKSGCKVTGGGSYKSGTKVTLKATASKTAMFDGWYADEECTKKVSAKASYAFKTGSDNSTLYAKFTAKKTKLAETTFNCFEPYTLVAGKKCSVKLSVSSPLSTTLTVSGLPKGLSFKKGVVSGTPTKPGTSKVKLTAKNPAGTKTKTVVFTVLNPGFDMTVSGFFEGTGGEATAISSGRTIEVPIGVSQTIKVSSIPGLEGVSKSGATVKVSGLPTGLKYSSGKITGVPTKKGEKKTVKITFSNKWGWSSSFSFKMNVVALPDWTVGTFYGGNTNCSASVTISLAGKTSGKVLFANDTWTLVASSLSADAALGGYRIKVTCTNAKKKKTTMYLLLVKLNDGRGHVEAEDGTFWAEPSIWKSSDGWKAASEALAGTTCEIADATLGTLTLTMTAGGTVAVSDGYRSASAMLFPFDAGVVPTIDPDTGMPSEFDAELHVFLPARTKSPKKAAAFRKLHLAWNGSTWEQL